MSNSVWLCIELLCFLDHRVNTERPKVGHWILCQDFVSHSGADEYGGVLGNDTLASISVELGRSPISKIM